MKLRRFVLLLVILATAGACPWSNELREFLNRHFWLPFARQAAGVERPDVTRADEPFAGMSAARSDRPLDRLRHAYQQMPVWDSWSRHPSPPIDLARLRQALAAARADHSLTSRDQEEVDLVEAKIEMCAGEVDNNALLDEAKKKFEIFLRTARTPELLSEARGWLGHVYYVLGNQTAAGKIYLDELNRPGSNLSRETVLNSLRMTYGYDGGAELLAHLDEYFDTPEHAGFAIQLATNPRITPRSLEGRFEHPASTAETYRRIRDLLDSHQQLLRFGTGSNALALLSMRTALRMGDPAGARRIATSIPTNAATRAEPDFLWMSASAPFLTHHFNAAEQPLLALFRARRATPAQRAAAAYGLCVVYWKTRNPAGQLRYALWLHGADPQQEHLRTPSGLDDLSVYWASSGRDLGLLLESGAPIAVLRTFIAQNPKLPEIWLAQYALAVRLAREEHYRESAQWYTSVQAPVRAQRMLRLAALQEAVDRPGLHVEAKREALYRLAEFLAHNPERLYFNDKLWQRMQTYALHPEEETRATRAERHALTSQARQLKDSQEERWRAYPILKDLAVETGPGDLRRRSARLALQCLRGINGDRFGREAEILTAGTQMAQLLAAPK